LLIYLKLISTRTLIFFFRRLLCVFGTRGVSSHLLILIFLMLFCFSIYASQLSTHCPASTSSYSQPTSSTFSPPSVTTPTFSTRSLLTKPAVFLKPSLRKAIVSSAFLSPFTWRLPVFSSRFPIPSLLLPFRPRSFIIPSFWPWVLIPTRFDPWLLVSFVFSALLDASYLVSLSQFQGLFTFKIPAFIRFFFSASPA